MISTGGFALISFHPLDSGETAVGILACESVNPLEAAEPDWFAFAVELEVSVLELDLSVAELSVLELDFSVAKSGLSVLELALSVAELSAFEPDSAAEFVLSEVGLIFSEVNFEL